MKAEILWTSEVFRIETRRRFTRLELVMIFLRCLCCCMMLGSFCSAQNVPVTDLPPPPSSGLLDEEGVLTSRPEVARKICKALNELNADHGFRVFVVIKRILIAGNAEEFASMLHKEWLPDGGGLVIVFEADTRKIGFGRSLEAEEEKGFEVVGIPAFAQMQIISKVLKKDSAQVEIASVVSEITAELTAWFQRKNAPVTGGRSLRLGLVTVGTLSFVALCGMAGSWLLRRGGEKRSGVRVFRPVNLPERLAAPYGGGCGASHSFGPRKRS